MDFPVHIQREVDRTIGNIKAVHAGHQSVLDSMRNYTTPGPGAIKLYATAPWELYYVKIIAWN
jgi:hypothetical protein